MHCCRRATWVVSQKSEMAAYQGPGMVARGEKQSWYTQVAQKKRNAEKIARRMRWEGLVRRGLKVERYAGIEAGTVEDDMVVGGCCGLWCIDAEKTMVAYERVGGCGEAAEERGR